MRIYNYITYVAEILLILLCTQNVNAGCIKRIKTRKGGKASEKENLASKKNNPIAGHKSDSWPNNAAAEDFPTPIKAKRLRKGGKAIKFEKIQHALRSHREELHAYHLTNGNLAATHAIGSKWSNAQIAKDAEQMVNTSDTQSKSSFR